MGVGKSKIDPCPLSLSLSKSHSVDTSQRHHESDSRNSKLPLRDVAGHSSTTEMPTGEQGGAEGVDGMSDDEAEEEVFFKFVILHAEDDLSEALRVQDLL